MQRKASAVWKGGLKDGKGTISAPSGVLKETQYSFSTRFENGQGTNPEELIAAAHAGCFSMALSAQLGEAKLTPESISTTVTLSLDKLDSGWTITASHIDVVGKVPGADAATFQKYAEAAEKGCPVSKVLNAKIKRSAMLWYECGLKFSPQRTQSHTNEKLGGPFLEILHCVFDGCFDRR